MIDSFVKYAPTIATLFFFITFCFIVFSVFKKGTKKKFDEYSQMPFDHENEKSEDKTSRKNSKS